MKLCYPNTTSADVNAYYAYDAMSRVTQINRGTNLAAAYQYDELSRKMLLKYGNDTNIVYSYDIGNRLKRLTNNLGDGTTIDFNYADYDKVGNRKSMKINDANAQIYSYDKLYQLTFVDYNNGDSTSYGYDLLGNRTFVTNGSQTSYESNRLNQYTKVNTTSYTYDKNSNLTYDGVYRYYYDCENRLTDVNNVADEAIVSYKYDYQGRRVAKADYTLPATRYTLFCYDGDQIIADYNEAGVLQKRYVYGPGIDESLCMLDSAGTHWYFFDGLGSVVALARTNQPLGEKYTYDVFGKPTIRNTQDAILTTSAVSNRYMFTAREFEPETGLYYYRVRYYHPAIGRFMLMDRIGYEDGLNLYTYVSNNPVNSVDPSGEKCCPKPTSSQPPREYRVDYKHPHHDKKTGRDECPHWHYRDYNWASKWCKWIPGGWEYGGPGTGIE